MNLGTAVVTGAASGIGLACARILLARNTRLALIDRDHAALASIYAPYGDRVCLIAADIARPQACGEAIARAIEGLGHVDALLHFAGVLSAFSWEQADEAEWDRVLGINLKGAFFLAQAAARHMVARGAGSIVLIGSDSTRFGGTVAGPAYVASKGGVVALTRSLARSLGPKGVRVNAISPGLIETPMIDGWSPEKKAGAAAQVPLGRLGNPEEIAAVACFLASDEARYIVGDVIEVNGGSYFD